MRSLARGHMTGQWRYYFDTVNCKTELQMSCSGSKLTSTTTERFAVPNESDLEAGRS